MFLSKVHGLCCKCQIVETSKCRKVTIIILLCVKNIFMGFGFAGLASARFMCLFFSTYWLSDVCVFNRTAIGYWLLAFGFLANSQ